MIIKRKTLYAPGKKELRLQTEDFIKKQITDYIENKKEKYIELSDKIWELAEPKFQEYESSKLQQQILAEEGFTIKNNLAGMETAFVASYGSGYPVIGILGEFDALPGLSQVAGVDEQEALESGACGHGCGHNLLGTAGVFAAVAVKEYLQNQEQEIQKESQTDSQCTAQKSGTIRYYGCPGEEGGAGKAFMVREGCFEDVDICISWHPGSFDACAAKTVANIHVTYEFNGVSSHASAAPEFGRSALDAAELMNVGVNYLREHVTSDVRMHYAFTDAGGIAPNVVPAHAEMVYAIRANTTQMTKEVYERVNKIAEGAAMMTETEVKIKPFSAYANVLENVTLDQLAKRSMEKCVGLAGLDEDISKVDSMISTDVGDVSWNVPTACFYLTTASEGTQLHTWQMTAQGKSEKAHAGMVNAAKVMAEMAAELMEHPELVEKSVADFRKAKGEMQYECLIPVDVKPGE